MNFYFPTVFISLAGSTVSAGFPSLSNDYTELSLDLNSHLIESPCTTFCLRARGNAMEGAGIYDGDLVLADRSLVAQNGNMVIGVLDGEFTVKRLRMEEGRTFLLTDYPCYEPIPVTETDDFRIWGVVTYIIHKTYKL